MPVRQQNRYPEWARGKDNAWHAFAKRARVLIVNTDQVPEKDRPRSILDLTDKRWKDRVVMSKPMFGTSATQAACLFEVLGSEEARDYYHLLRQNGVQLAPGNKQVAEWVGRGLTARGDHVDIGITDTDDAMGEIKAGSHVVMIFPDREKNEKYPAHGYALHSEHVGYHSPQPESCRRPQARRLPVES